MDFADTSGGLVRAPRVRITMRAKCKLDLYARRCASEISGLGRLETLPGGDLLVSDVFLLDQASDNVSTVIDPEALVRFAVEEETGGGRFSFWWHSHGDMRVFFSRTDEGTIDGWAGFGDYLVSLVVNRRGEAACRLDVYRPLRITADVEFACVEECELAEEVERDIRERVSVRSREEDVSPRRPIWSKLLEAAKHG